MDPGIDPGTASHVDGSRRQNWADPSTGGRRIPGATALSGPHAAGLPPIAPVLPYPELPYPELPYDVSRSVP
jgi:hypothetical protein